ncbi:MAG: 3-keto-disaccharide hydrolase [Aurantibacter sp.]
MKKSILLFGLSITLFSIMSCAEKNISKEVLFEENGKDWFSQGDAQWKFVDGELVGSLESGTGFVMTKKSYKDFVLELEFKPDSTINSGIFIRCKENEISNIDCYEINIWDLHPDQKSRTGAVVTRSTPMAKVETLGKWNSYKIKNEKDHLQVWIDGILTADMEDQDLVEGPIALQAAEAGQIMFRNVRLTPID